MVTNHTDEMKMKEEEIDTLKHKLLASEETIKVKRKEKFI